MNALIFSNFKISVLKVFDLAQKKTGEKGGSMSNQLKIPQNLLQLLKSDISINSKSSLLSEKL